VYAVRSAVAAELYVGIAHCVAAVHDAAGGLRDQPFDVLDAVYAVAGASENSLCCEMRVTPA